MKRIYFGCSIAGGRDYAHLYEDIVAIIKASGVEVMSEMFANKTIQSHLGPTPHLTAQETWSRDVGMVKSADALIAEVTQPSLGVGYEIGVAETLKKPMLVLFYKESGRRLSPMITGNPAVQVLEYTAVKDLTAPIATFLENLA